MHVQACTHVPVYAGQVQVCCATSVRCAEHLHSFLRFGVGMVACLGAVSTRSIDLATRSQSWHRAARNRSLNATAQASKDRGGTHPVRTPCTSEFQRLGLWARPLEAPKRWAVGPHLRASTFLSSKPSQDRPGQGAEPSPVEAKVMAKNDEGVEERVVHE